MICMSNGLELVVISDGLFKALIQYLSPISSLHLSAHLDSKLHERSDKSLFYF
jgi:hypothetical protein